MFFRSVVITVLAAVRVCGEPGPLGMEMVAVPAGRFAMGSAAGNWDEAPVRHVTLTEPFLISKLEVSRLQFRQFRPDHPSPPTMKAISVTWNDAVAFCEWLSAREGKHYRLPTEAEWEYACRLHGADGEGKLTGMLDDVAEWCLDWYGEYPAENEIDPVGPVSGLARVLRGSKPDVSDRVIAPSFGRPHSESLVSFRVVQAPPPKSAPRATQPRLFSSGVKQTTGDAAKRAVSADRPYFRKRYVFPTPPESWEGNRYEEPQHARKLEALALHPGIGGHQHSAALEVLPNGDLLYVAYTCWTEYNPEVGFIATRMRLGHDEWEMPSFAFDLPGANDHAPLLWTDGARTHLFWGNPKLPPPRPAFQWITTEDSGATWTEVQYPKFISPIGPHESQPINSVLRDRDGVIYVAADAPGIGSILYTSDDDMKTWADPGGRSYGGHTTFALLSDGKTIFGLNSRKTHIDHYMTSSLSSDGAKTFVTGKTPFAWGGSNQRASILRLASGRLVAAGDYQHSTDRSPAEFQSKFASFVAYSDDDGKTWRMRDLPGGQLHETRKSRGFATIGYSVLRQGRDGLIHLVTTMNEPCLHFAFNEAWLSSPTEIDGSDAILMANTAGEISDVSEYKEHYPDGKLRAHWRAGIGDDGRYLLHGFDRWYYPDGTLQYEASFALGRRVGREVFYDSRGRKFWEWNHDRDGRSTWIQYWPNEAKKAESSWFQFQADGPARRWTAHGRLISDVTFRNGDTRRD